MCFQSCSVARRDRTQPAVGKNYRPREKTPARLLTLADEETDDAELLALLLLLLTSIARVYLLAVTTPTAFPTLMFQFLFSRFYPRSVPLPIESTKCIAFPSDQHSFQYPIILFDKIA
jgi:hypothetical protein